MTQTLVLIDKDYKAATVSMLRGINENYAWNEWTKKSITRHIIIKFPKEKMTKILKATRVNTLLIKEKQYKLTQIFFLSETMEAERNGIAFFKCWKKNCQSMIPCSLKTSFRNEEEIKSFLDEGKLREFVISRPNWKEQLTEVL